MIKITFPDGGVREYESGITAYDVAASISSRLAQDILVASVKAPNQEEWQIVELNAPITEDCEIRLHKWEDKEVFYLYKKTKFAP